MHVHINTVNMAAPPAPERRSRKESAANTFFNLQRPPQAPRGNTLKYFTQKGGAEWAVEVGGLGASINTANNGRHTCSFQTCSGAGLKAAGGVWGQAANGVKEQGGGG